MTVIRYYTRQISHHRRGDFGQATVLFITVLATVLLLAFHAIYISYLGVEKVTTSNAIDAIALSAATWEARGLNIIASLNNGILQCFRAIRWICVIWAALAVAAVCGAGMALFVEYSSRAPKMIRSYWKTAKQLERWAEKVKELIPPLVLMETTSLSLKLKVTGMLFPPNPKGPHDGENTLELHLKHGPPLGLLDALAPIMEIPSRIDKWKWAKNIARTINAIISGAISYILSGTDGTPIRMLEPEEDFPRRQFVRFAGFKWVSPLLIPYLGNQETPRFPMIAHAEPYGGDTTEMTWKSRLTEKKKNEPSPAN